MPPASVPVSRPYTFSAVFCVREDTCFNDAIRIATLPEMPMSDRPTTSHEHADDNYHEANHEGPIKTVKQLIVAVLLAFIVPIAVIVLLVSYVSAQNKPAAGSDRLGEAGTAERLAPVGTVAIKDASDTSALKNGEQVYAAQCSACHAAGVANAPKLGDEAAWAPRIKQGYEVLLTAALKGKGVMAAQAGGDFSDLEIGRAVVHMANAGGAKFDEPKAAAAPSADAASAAPAANAAAASAAPAPPAAADVAAKLAAATQAATAPPAATAATADAAPPALYGQACQVCHASGVALAPKLGDKAAWAPRVTLGIDKLTQSVVAGKGVMPPKGGAATASEADIKAVVAYMLESVK